MWPSLLIVDDNPDRLGMSTNLFIKRGCHVIPTSHPRRALEAASIHMFHVALINFSLPEMDGMELLRRLKRIQHSLQGIILTSQDDEYQHTEAGAFAILTTPLLPALLESTFNQACEHARDEEDGRLSGFVDDEGIVSNSTALAGTVLSRLAAPN